MPEDTICSVSTPPGEGAIGIIRLSGPRALETAGGVFTPTGKKDAGNLTPRVLYNGIIRDAEGFELDDVLFAFYKGPRSYTGEDMAEIFCHGGHWLTERILLLLLALGARPAGPGEFTRRAFLNGKIDLAQAESVAAVIRAGSDLELKLTRKMLKGEFSSLIESIRSSLIDISSKIETLLEFPEDDGTDRAETAGILEDAAAVKERIEGLLKKSRMADSVKRGINIVITGLANTGKSTLMNRLVGYEKSIVTHVPGTTRDILEEKMHLKGYPVNLIDTAGLKRSGDIVERIGVRRSVEKIKASDLVLFVIDLSAEDRRKDEKLYGRLKAKKHLLVGNKLDLAKGRALPEFSGRSVLPLSAKTGEGIEALENAIKEKLGLMEISVNDVVTVQKRHHMALREAGACLDAFINNSREGVTLDFLAEDIRKAARSLSLITGEIVTEDILDSIFSKFCIGK